MKPISLLILTGCLIALAKSDTAGDQIEALIEGSLQAKQTISEDADDIQLMDTPQSIGDELSKKYSQIYSEAVTKNENLPVENDLANDQVANVSSFKSQIDDVVSETNNSIGQDMNSLEKSRKSQVDSALLVETETPQNLSGNGSQLLQTNISGQNVQDLSDKVVSMNESNHNSQGPLETSPLQSIGQSEQLVDTSGFSGESNRVDLSEVNKTMNNDLENTSVKDFDEDQNQELSDLDAFNSQLDKSQEEFKNSQDASPKSQEDISHTQSAISNFQSGMQEDQSQVPSNMNSVPDQDMLSDKEVLDSGLSVRSGELSNLGMDKSQGSLIQDVNLDGGSQHQSSIDELGELNEEDDMIINKSQPVENVDDLSAELNQDLQETGEVSHVSEVVQEASHISEASNVNEVEQEASHKSVVLDTEEAQENISHTSEVHDTEEASVVVQQNVEGKWL